MRRVVFDQLLLFARRRALYGAQKETPEERLSFRGNYLPKPKA